MNPFFSRFAKDNLLVGSGHVLNFIKPLALTPLILKAAPAEVFGAYVLVMSITGFIAGFAPAGADFLCKRHLPAAETPQRRRELFYPQLLFQGAVFLLCGAGLLLLEKPLLSLFFKDAPAFSMPLAAAYMLCYAAYAQFTDYFRYTGRMRAYTAATVTYPYLSLALVVALRLALGTFTVDGLLLAEIGALLAVVLVLAWRVAGELGLALPPVKAGELWESVRLGFPLLMVSVNEFFLFAGARYIIAAFLGVGSVAWFTAAAQLGNLALVLPRALGVALPPLLCKAEDSGHRREFSLMLEYSVKGYLLLALPFAAVTLFAGKDLLRLFSNAAVADAAWQLVPVVAFANVLYGVALIVSKVFVVEKKTDSLFNASALSSGLSLGLNLLLVWLTGSVLSTGAAVLASYAAMLVVLLKSSPRSREALAPMRFGRLLAASAAAAAVYFAAARLAPAGGPAAAVWLSALAGAAYLALLIPLDLVTKHEREFAGKLLARRG